MRDARSLLLCAVGLLFAACYPQAPTGFNNNAANGTDNENPKGCGSVTAKGSCQSGVAVTCSSNQLSKDNCASRGLACVVDDTHGATCAPKSSDTSGGGSSCGAVTAGGTCDGTTKKACVSGKVQTTDCAATSQVCQVANGTAKCVADNSIAGSTLKDGDPCGNTVTPQGICVTNPPAGTSPMLWCVNGKVKSSDCAYDNGSVCKMQDGSAICTTGDLPGGGGGGGGTSNPCDTIGKGKSTCSGYTVQKCDAAGTYSEEDCTTVPSGYCAQSGDTAYCDAPAI